MFIDPQVINTTAFLAKDGEHVGTVFFIGVGLHNLDIVLKDRGRQFYAITASHCVPDDGINIEWPNGKDPTPTLGTDWFRNDDVDLAVLPLDFKPAEYKIKPLPFYRFVVNPKDETKGLKDSRRDVVIFECRTGHEVFTVGLFASDDGSLGVTQPIVRFGHIALSPASSEQVFIRNRLGQDVPTTGPLVEMAVWRGQSGSPIFYQDRPHEPLEHGREYENTYLLGVAQGFYLGQQDVEINGEQATIRGLGMGISVVIPSSQIIKILMRPTLVEARERKLKQILKDHAPELAELRKRYKGLPA